MKERALGVGLIALIITNPMIAETLYSIIDLGTLGGEYSHAWGINDCGQVIGNSSTPEGEYHEYHAFIWDAYDGMRDIDTLRQTNSLARGINNHGHIVGSYGYYPAQAFIWDDVNGMRPLLLGSYRCEASSINDDGFITGWIQLNINDELETFLIDPNNGYNNLGGWGGAAINKHTQIAGSYLFPREAALWTNRSALLLGIGQAYGLNDFGDVVGSTYDGEQSGHAFMWTSEDGMQIISSDVQSSANDINNEGLVVGSEYHRYPNPTYPFDAFIWQAGEGIQLLAELIDYNETPYDNWRLCTAMAINENGQIVGSGWHSNMPQHYDTAHAYIMTPIPPDEILAVSNIEE